MKSKLDFSAVLAAVSAAAGNAVRSFDITSLMQQKPSSAGSKKTTRGFNTLSQKGRRKRARQARSNGARMTRVGLRK